MTAFLRLILTLQPLPPLRLTLILAETGLACWMVIFLLLGQEEMEMSLYLFPSAGCRSSRRRGRGIIITGQ